MPACLLHYYGDVFQAAEKQASTFARCWAHALRSTQREHVWVVNNQLYIDLPDTVCIITIAPGNVHKQGSIKRCHVIDFFTSPRIVTIMQYLLLILTQKKENPFKIRVGTSQNMSGFFNSAQTIGMTKTDCLLSVFARTSALPFGVSNLYYNSNLCVDMYTTPETTDFCISVCMFVISKISAFAVKGFFDST